jgi:hypothetical protein
MVLSNRNQQEMHFTQSLIQKAAAPAQTSAPAVFPFLKEKNITRKPKAIITEPLKQNIKTYTV